MRRVHLLNGALHADLSFAGTVTAIIPRIGHFSPRQSRVRARARARYGDSNMKHDLTERHTRALRATEHDTTERDTTERYAMLSLWLCARWIFAFVFFFAGVLMVAGSASIVGCGRGDIGTSVLLVTEADHGDATAQDVENAAQTPDAGVLDASASDFDGRGGTDDDDAGSSDAELSDAEEGEDHDVGDGGTWDTSSASDGSDGSDASDASGGSNASDAGDLDSGRSGVPDAAVPLAPGSHTVSAKAGGYDRQILVYVPSGWEVGDAAAVALHGNGDSASNFLVSMGLRASADANGIALALPRAMSGHFQGLDWDAYTQPVSSNPDIAVVEAAHALLAAGGADPDRIYLLGYSQGGFLSYRVAMERPDLFAAAHVSGASCPLPGYGLEADASRKIPMDLLIGTNDSLLPNARESRATLIREGFEVRYAELAGVGHCCPLQNRATDVLAWFLDHTL